MIDAPDFFGKLVDLYTSQGFRLNALACKELGSPEGSREELEKGLSYVGLMVLSSPLKSTTFEIIQELNGAEFKCLMITGDNVYTAGQVGRWL